MSAAAASAAPKPGHGNAQAPAAPAKPQLELVHNVAEPENGVTPPKGELHSVKEGEVPSWKELALSPFKWMSKSVRRLLVGAPPAVGSVIGWTREKVGDVMGTGWGVTRRTGELIQRNLRSISIEPFGIPLMRTGIVRLDASIYSMCDKKNCTLLPNYFARDLILDRDIKFAAGSYLMGQRPHRGYNWRSVQNRVYGPLERVFDAVTGKEITLGEPLKEDLVIHAGTLIGKGTHLARKSEIMGQAHREMTDKLFEEIITRDEGRFTHNWTLQQPGNRTYRLPLDLKVGVDMPNGIGRAFTDPNGGVHAVGANITAGTVIPAGTEIDSGMTIPYNTRIVKAEEIDEIPEQQLEKTVALKEKIVLKSPLRVGAPMRIRQAFTDYSVNPPVNYDSNAWIPTGAVIPSGTLLAKNTKITAGSELMQLIKAVSPGTTQRWAMFEQDFVLPADLRLGQELPQGVPCEINVYLDAAGNPLPNPNRIRAHTPLPEGTWIPANTKIPKNAIFPPQTTLLEEIEEQNINSNTADRLRRIILSELRPGENLVEKARLRGPTRIVGNQTLERDVELSEYGLIVDEDFVTQDKLSKLVNPRTGEPYKVEVKDIPFEYLSHKFAGGKKKYLRFHPEHNLLAGTLLLDGMIIAGGSFLAVPSHGPVLPGGRLTADFNLDNDFTMGGPLKLGRAMPNPFGHDLEIDGITYTPGQQIHAGALIPHQHTAPAVLGAPPPTPVTNVIPAGIVIPGGSEIISTKLDLEKVVSTARTNAVRTLRLPANATNHDESVILALHEVTAYQAAITALTTDKRQAAQDVFDALIKDHCTKALEAANKGLDTAVLTAKQAAEVALRTTYSTVYNETTILATAAVSAYQTAINALPTDKRQAAQDALNSLVQTHCVKAASDAVLATRRTAEVELAKPAYVAVYDKPTLLLVPQIVAYQTAVNALPNDKRAPAQDALNDLIQKHCDQASKKAVENLEADLLTKRTDAQRELATPAYATVIDRTALGAVPQIVAYQSAVNALPPDKRNVAQDAFNTFIQTHCDQASKKTIETLEGTMLTKRREAQRELGTPAHATIHDKAVLLGIPQVIDYQTAIDALPPDKRTVAQDAFNTFIQTHCDQVLESALTKTRREAVIELGLPIHANTADETLLSGIPQVDAYQKAIVALAPEKRSAQQSTFDSIIANHQKKVLETAVLSARREAEKELNKPTYAAVHDETILLAIPQFFDYQKAIDALPPDQRGPAQNVFNTTVNTHRTKVLKTAALSAQREAGRELHIPAYAAVHDETVLFAIPQVVNYQKAIDALPVDQREAEQSKLNKLIKEHRIEALFIAAIAATTTAVNELTLLTGKKIENKVRDIMNTAAGSGFKANLAIKDLEIVEGPGGKYTTQLRGNLESAVKAKVG